VAVNSLLLLGAGFSRNWDGRLARQVLVLVFIRNATPS